MKMRDRHSLFQTYTSCLGKSHAIGSPLKLFDQVLDQSDYSYDKIDIKLKNY